MCATTSKVYINDTDFHVNIAMSYLKKADTQMRGLQSSHMAEIMIASQTTQHKIDAD